MPKERKRKTYELNPLCEMFPPMPDDQLAELAEDIQKNGQKHPVQLDAEGRILDGRNRQLAWLAALTVKPLKVQKWKGKASRERYVDYIISNNLHRRHQYMNKAQRAQMIVSLRDEDLASIGGQQYNSIDDSAKIATSNRLASEAGVGVRAITTARAVHAKATPEQEKAVIAGTLRPADILRPNRPTATQPMRKLDDLPDDDSFTEDIFGNKLPKHVSDDFAEVHVLLDFKNRIDALKRDIMQAAQDGERIMRFVRTPGVETDLKNLGAAIRFAMPYCLCPYCGGDATHCKTCEKSGWLPKKLYEQIVPREMQWKAKAKA